MDSKKRELIIESLRNTFGHYSFYLRVRELAAEHFAQYIGKVITKREANKLLNEIQKAYPSASLYFKSEKWGRECQFLLRNEKGREECREFVKIESMCSNKIYTAEVHQIAVESAKAIKKHYDTCEAQLNNINELIDLHDKQDTEREELAKRHELERRTFAAQCKCPDTSISHHIGAAEKAILEEERDQYYRDLEAQRQAQFGNQS